MICEICGESTDNIDSICDDCKLSILYTDGIPPDIEDFEC